MQDSTKWIICTSALVAAIATTTGYLFLRYQNSKQKVKGKRNKKRGSVNIGGMISMVENQSKNTSISNL